MLYRRVLFGPGRPGDNVAVVGRRRLAGVVRVGHDGDAADGRRGLPKGIPVVRRDVALFPDPRSDLVGAALDGYHLYPVRVRVVKDRSLFDPVCPDVIEGAGGNLVVPEGLQRPVLDAVEEAEVARVVVKQDVDAGRVVIAVFVCGVPMLEDIGHLPLPRENGVLLQVDSFSTHEAGGPAVTGGFHHRRRVSPDGAFDEAVARFVVDFAERDGRPVLGMSVRVRIGRREVTDGERVRHDGHACQEKNAQEDTAHYRAGMETHAGSWHL
jgi:hypothetical protein